MSHARIRYAVEIVASVLVGLSLLPSVIAVLRTEDPLRTTVFTANHRAQLGHPTWDFTGLANLPIELAVGQIALVVATVALSALGSATARRIGLAVLAAWSCHLAYSLWATASTVTHVPFLLAAGATGVFVLISLARLVLAWPEPATERTALGHSPSEPAFVPVERPVSA